MNESSLRRGKNSTGLPDDLPDPEHFSPTRKDEPVSEAELGRLLAPMPEKLAGEFARACGFFKNLSKKRD
jgi:hypothetical protein